MANPAQTDALQSTKGKEAHRSDIAGTTSGVVTTACEVVKELGGLLENVPYVEAIAGMIGKIAAIKDEMMNNKKRCAELTERVCSGLTSVSSNLEKIASSVHPELHGDLQNDLRKFLSFLDEIQTQLVQWRTIGRVSRLLKRADIRETMQQYERRISAFYEQFNADQMVRLQIALIKKVETRSTAIIPQPLPPKPRVVIGRGEEILKILDALKNHDKTPVRAAVLGPGGMGKTTIALSILHDSEIEAQYKAERYFISCESATNVELLINNIADVIGLPSTGREQNQLISQVNAFFRDRHAVLCIDNLETTWDDPAHRPEVNKIIGLLSAIPALVMIITMRGTQSPGSQDIVWLKVEITPVTSDDALDIYRKRALREPDVWARKLIEAVDNIPLAVTLISHLVQEDGQSPHDLWVRWQKGRTSVLENGGSDRLSKLDASIWLSVQSPRMDDKSRNLLHLLSFLPDGLHSEFKFKILLPGVPDLSSLLITLQRVSLIYTSPIPGSTAMRYNMLSPIREYCQNTTNFNPSPWPQWKSAFTAFFTDLVADHWDSNNALHYSTVVPELRNIRSILMETTQESTLNALTAIWYTEWSRYIGFCDEEVIVKSLQVMHDPSDLAWGFRTLGTTQGRKDNLDGAYDSLKKALKFSEEARDSRATARTLLHIAELRLRRNNLDEAESSLLNAQVLYDEVGSFGDRANVRLSIGRLHMRRNNLDDAEQLFATALPLYEAAQDAIGQANVHRNTGELRMQRGNLDDAEKSFSAALALYQQIQHVYSQANVYTRMGKLHMKRGDLDDAEKSYSDALTLYRQIQNVLGQANVHRNMGELQMKRGDLDGAGEFFSTAFALFQQIQDDLGQANVHLNMGTLHMKRGDLDDAEQRFSVALTLYQQIQDVDGQADVNDEIGKMHLERGNLGAAQVAFSTSLAVYEQLQNTRCQDIVRGNIRRLDERKAMRPGDDSIREAASLS